jgi:hypothetical protein
MSHPATPIQHLRALQALLEELAQQNIALESHEYDAMVFGNFGLVLGSKRNRVRFTWDGKESVLTVEYKDPQTHASGGPWVHDAYISVCPREAVFAEIGSNAVSIL